MKEAHASLTQADPGQYEASDQAMDGKVRENFTREPEFSDAGVISGGIADGQGRGEVLVQGGHDNHGERGVEQVVTPDKDGVKHALETDKDRCELTKKVRRWGQFVRLD